MYTKTAKGCHCFYRHPGTPIGNRAKLKGMPLDVRGDGGYVVAAPSIHYSGHHYEKHGEWYSTANLPVFDPGWIQEEKKILEPTIRVDEIVDIGQLQKRAQAYIKKIISESGKGGDRECFKVVCRLKDFGLRPEEAWPVLLEWNRTNALPRWSEKALIHKMRSVFGGASALFLGGDHESNSQTV